MSTQRNNISSVITVLGNCFIKLLRRCVCGHIRVCTPACAQERVRIRISMYKSICECVPKIALNSCHTANSPYKLILYTCAYVPYVYVRECMFVPANVYEFADVLVSCMHA